MPPTVLTSVTGNRTTVNPDPSRSRATPGSQLDTDDAFDIRWALGATGLLKVFNQAEVLAAADVHVAATVGRLGSESDERVLLAVALTVRAIRQGSVCVDLSTQPGLQPALPWPDPVTWTDLVRASPLCADGGAQDVDVDVVGVESPRELASGEGTPLRFDAGLFYLDRYWRQEVQVCTDLLGRAAMLPPPVDEARLTTGLQRLFPDQAVDPRVSSAVQGRQREAAEAAVRLWTTIIGGGPGTGKTTTVAKVLALLLDQPGSRPRIAMAAPTGKAAARLQEAVQRARADLGPVDRERLGAISASTMHRLLGWNPQNRSRFRHHRDNRLPFDVIVIDETSMVSLTLMARLLEAVRPETRLILVGDPDQLEPVEAGAVLADLIAGLTQRNAAAATSPRAATADPHPRAKVAPAVGCEVVILEQRHRFEGAIATLADAVRDGNADAALAELLSADPTVTLLPDGSGADLRADVLGSSESLREAAVRGDPQAALAALDRHRLLCAHRTGPYGVEKWGGVIERWIAEDRGRWPEGQWYLGRPVLVTANDDVIGLYNGDTGVVIASSTRRDAQSGSNRDGYLDGQREPVTVVFPRGADFVRFPTSRVPEVLTMHAMTVHRSQGSQFDRVTLVLPEPGSPLLTRELLYTAITRAQSRVRIVGSEEAFREAVSRRAIRASGLRERLSRP